ncbi:MAG TPA: thiamine-phosphate kinase [Polyangiaceae bacterium]|nr:thiamine-phosphate kinase [Polyangiaceae bacterium]
MSRKKSAIGSTTGEFEKIAVIERLHRGAAPRAAWIETGIGDDAAVIEIARLVSVESSLGRSPRRRSSRAGSLDAAGRLVWTVDAQVDGQHFRRDWVDLEDTGYRSFQAAVSDLAAMGAAPVGALSSLALPSALSDVELSALVTGQAIAARECRCPVIGGNLTRAEQLSITTTVLGRARRPLLRSGARPGHELWLIGEVGEAAAGLRALQRGARKTRAVRECIEAWRRPRAQLAAGQRLVGRASAAIDVSDGLMGDAAHLAQASGVRLTISVEQLQSVCSEALRGAARQLGEDELTLALSGGEDYALLATGPRESRPRGARVIGIVERGRGVELDGPRPGLSLHSFDHFRA